MKKNQNRLAIQMAIALICGLTFGSLFLVLREHLLNSNPNFFKFYATCHCPNGFYFNRACDVPYL